MNISGKFVIRIATVVMLLLQLMSPTLARADGETPPPPSETTQPPITPSLTDPATTESPTPEETSPTATEPASPTVEPVETVAPTETPVPVPTDSPTEIIPTEVPTDQASPTIEPVETNTPAETETPPAESPTLDDSTSTPVPADSATPDIPSNTPDPFATDPTSPTVDPVETITSISTPPNTTEPSNTLEVSHTAIPEESSTGTIPTESSTPTETPTRERTPRTPETTTATPEPTETAVPIETVTVEPPALLESVQALPGSTSVVVLDANGQPLPLVTQDAADTIANGDPIWCPAGQTPTPGANGCTFSNTSLATLLSNLSGSNGHTGIGADGTIWIESSYNSSVNDPAATGFTLDGSTLTTWANYSLTLQGGWDGVYGSTVIGSNSVSSVPITITNWNNGITIQNIDAPSITISDTTIQNNGISVTNVNSDVNIRRINVNRTDGVFGHGLQIITSGNINLEDITATANNFTQGDGAFLDNTSGTGNVTLTGTNIFSNHHIYSSGMYIVSNGTVSLSNITSNNSGRGVNISRAGSVSITNGTFNDSFVNNLYVTNVTGDVSLNGISIDGANGTGTGLYVDTFGAIMANNITSNNNHMREDGSCPINCGNGAYLIGAAGVTLTGTNVFHGNAWTGLEVWSFNGDITLENVSASTNGGFGSYLVNYSTGNVTLTGTNSFNNNGNSSYWHGLQIYSYGNINLSNVTASQNGFYGVELDCWGGGSTATLGGVNVLNNNFDSGLFANCLVANVNLNGNTTANNNGGYGVWINGTDVTLSGSNVFNENPYGGLVVNGTGNVTLNDVTAFGNNGFQNYGVIIFDSGNVSLTGGTYTSNGTGLYIQCVSSVTFNLPQTQIINNTFQDIFIDPACPVPVTYSIPTIVTQRQGESFALDCKNADGYSVNLPNGDLVQIFCPVSGTATISRRDSTALPGDLPDGYSYASAFQADIVQGGESIRVITEGGSIKASFVGSSLQPGSTYSILYWDDDSSKWIPLKDFMLAENGNPLEFELNPGVPDDTRKIKSGVKLVTVFGEPRVEVSTNFPGIFVLAQH